MTTRSWWRDPYTRKTKYNFWIPEHITQNLPFAVYNDLVSRQNFQKTRRVFNLTFWETETNLWTPRHLADLLACEDYVQWRSNIIAASLLNWDIILEAANKTNTSEQRSSEGFGTGSDLMKRNVQRFSKIGSSCWSKHNRFYRWCSL